MTIFWSQNRRRQSHGAPVSRSFILKNLSPIPHLVMKPSRVFRPTPMSPLHSYISPSLLIPPSLFSLRCRASCLEYASHCSLSITSCIFRSPYFRFLGSGGGRAANPAWAPRNPKFVSYISPTFLPKPIFFLSQFILPTDKRNTN